MSGVERRQPVIHLLNDMETLRRLLRLYPEGHPSLGPARERVAKSAQALGMAVGGSLGISAGQIVWDGEEIAVPASVPCSRLVAQLFQLGIAALTLTFPQASDGLSRLAARLAAIRDTPGETERGELLAATDRFPGVELVPLDLSTVQLVEEDLVSSREAARFAWSELARRLQSRGAFLFGGKLEAGRLSPGVVVDLLARSGDQATLLDHLFAQIAEVVRGGQGAQRYLLWREARAFLGELLGLLDPDRRCLALVAATRHLEVSSPQRPDGAPEPLIRAATLLDAVEHMVANQIDIPVLIQQAVHALAAPPEVLPAAVPDDLIRRARALLPYLPLGAQAAPFPDEENPALGRLADAVANSPGAAELLASVGERELHEHLLRVLGEAVALWPREPVGERAAVRLAEEFVNALDLGDLDQAVRLVTLVMAAPSSEAKDLAVRGGTAAAVRALHAGERHNGPAVVTVLTALGDRALPDVLEALASEELLAVRKRLLEVVSRHGQDAVRHLLPLLDDPRWFVVRNAIFVLRRIGYRDMLPQLKAMLPDARPQVVTEILKALVTFEDPDWLRVLAVEMESADVQRAVAAISVASRIRHPRVVREIAERLRRRLTLRLRDDAVTAELIAALGRLRDSSALEILQQVVDMKQWRYPFSIATLRREAAVSIALLEGAEARRAAAMLVHDRDQDLAAAVRAALQPVTAPAEEIE